MDEEFKTEEEFESYLENKWVDEMETVPHPVLMRTLLLSAIHKYYIQQGIYDFDLTKYNDMSLEELQSIANKLNLVITLSK